MWQALSIPYVKLNIIVVYRDFMRLHKGHYDNVALWGDPYGTAATRMSDSCYNSCSAACCLPPDLEAEADLGHDFNAVPSALLQTGFAMFILMQHLIDRDTQHQKLRRKEFIPKRVKRSLIEDLGDDFDVDLLLHSLGEHGDSTYVHIW